MKNNGLNVLILGLSCTIATMACKKDSEKAETSAKQNKVETNLDNELILKLVNDTRTKGCDCKDKVTNKIDKMPPVSVVTWSEELALLAKAHSDDMAKRNYFSHNTLDGILFKERLLKGGYKFSAATENIAQSQTTEKEVVDSWLNSHEHCKNIMRADVKEMGAARTNGKEFTWTQIFGTKI